MADPDCKDSPNSTGRHDCQKARKRHSVTTGLLIVFQANVFKTSGQLFVEGFEN